MNLLTVAAAFDRFHQQIFRHKKGQILRQRLINHFFVDAKSACHVLGKPQNRIRAKESFRQRNAPVRRIVQRPFQPLRRCSHGGVCGVRNQITAEGADALAAHGIAFVGHGRRADLCILEGFRKLPVMLKQTYVVCHTITALRN